MLSLATDPVHGDIHEHGNSICMLDWGVQLFLRHSKCITTLNFIHAAVGIQGAVLQYQRL